ncbi:hypothetical protein [Nonomuraea basaltis]|uniref:hypothetical protein n=1 Tax=Nonomuraea basaltis TaxID=2495887 RepID=UPI00110C4ECA|nr:hypothetical protein [Nonomuraea basaltis]TMR93295.1 hypothetical protein EJK15_40050 [Nonomuraea basaltis]
MTTLARLEQVIGPPQGRPAPVDWEALHRRYGLRFPSDYQTLAARYPDLVVAEFLSVFHPASHERAWSDRMLDIPRSWSPRWLDSYTPYEDPIPVDWNGPFRVHPEPGGVFPWGITVNGDFCLWLTDPDPVLWTVLIAERHQVWHYKGTLTGFLCQVLTREISCPVFPADFPLGDDWQTEQDFSAQGDHGGRLEG